MTDQPPRLINADIADLDGPAGIGHNVGTPFDELKTRVGEQI